MPASSLRLGSPPAIQVVATTPPGAASVCPPRRARNGFRFVSTKTTLVHFAQIGRERNGVFF